MGSEHLLLGLLHEEQEAAIPLLALLGASLSRARVSVDYILGRGEDVPAPAPVRISARGQKVVDLAIRQAGEMGHSQVTAEHLLLALVLEGEGIGATVLESFGVHLDDVRDRALSVLAGPR
jgi:ATP-dependent Clp protease ATP-binding subunit ClpC